MIELNKISLSNEEKIILQDITLTIEKGKRYLLLGPSGSGKTSLLKILNNLYSPTKGEVLLDKKPFEDYNPTFLRQKIALIMQEPVMFGEFVYENFAFIEEITKEKIDKNEILKLFATFGLKDNFYNKKNSELSGGEKYRTSIIRALLNKPDYILTDEPFAALDKTLMLKIFGFLNDFALQKSIALVIVSHTFENIIKNFDTIIFMKDAKLIFQGRPDEFLLSSQNNIKNFLEGNDE